jgi:hypothetical protein
MSEPDEKYLRKTCTDCPILNRCVNAIPAVTDDKGCAKLLQDALILTLKQADDTHDQWLFLADYLNGIV